jgi:hypothetical protein
MNAASRQPGAPLTLLGFGYWGCGGATRTLVQAVNAVEASRSLEPPLWVDIRISRAVRAAGFRDDAFARLVKDRYQWMPELGNQRVKERRRGIQIKNPAAADDLLQLALDDQRRRVIFFCACPHPIHCHRYTVAQLLLKQAAARRIKILVQEWPGGEPDDELTLDVPLTTLKQVQREQRRTLPIPASMTAAETAALPWGTIAHLRAGTEVVNVLAGPPAFTAAGARLRIFPDEPGTRVNSKSFRAELGYSPVKR